MRWWAPRVRFYGTIANEPDALRSLCRRLSKDGRPLHFCYEAGPCGYGVQRHLTWLGHHCDVVAPALISRKVGDKVKTDRREAMMLAQTRRGGQLTAVWVPDEAHEAMRDLVQRLEVADRLAACIDDPRDPGSTVHTLADIIRFRLLMIAAGYKLGVLRARGRNA